MKVHFSDDKMFKRNALRSTCTFTNLVSVVVHEFRIVDFDTSTKWRMPCNVHQPGNSE